MFVGENLSVLGRKPLLRSIQNSSISTNFNTYFRSRVKFMPPKVSIPSRQPTQWAEPFCNVSKRSSTPPSTSPAISYERWQQRCWCEPLNLARNTAGGGGNADTRPGFKARTRISHSCLGHPARRPVPVGRPDRWHCAARAMARSLSVHRPTLARGLQYVWACCRPVSANWVDRSPGTLPTAQ